jgi:hypothetical protein
MKAIKNHHLLSGTNGYRAREVRRADASAAPMDTGTCMSRQSPRAANFSLLNDNIKNSISSRIFVKEPRAASLEFRV